jgi:transcription termination/antitermination protein NusA
MGQGSAWLLVAFAVQDLAGCASDDLCGWIEDPSGMLTRHEGVLHRFNISRRECDAMILHARINVGWI